MISESVIRYEDVLALAYRLTPLEKVKLVKRMADALEQEPVLVMENSLPPPSTPSENWGSQILTLLDSFGTNDWQTIEMDDVVEWVKQQRMQQNKQRGIIWEEAE